MNEQERLRTLERIAEIDTILASGASSVSVDGTTTAYSLTELRRERDELQKRLDAGSSKRRPFIYRPRLG